MIITITNTDNSTQKILAVSGDFIVADIDAPYPPSLDVCSEIAMRAFRSMSTTGDRKVVIGGIEHSVVVDRASLSVYVGSKHLSEMLMDCQRETFGKIKKWQSLKDILDDLPDISSYMGPPHHETQEEAARSKPKEYDRIMHYQSHPGDERMEDNATLAVADKIARIKSLAAQRKRR